MLVCAVGRLVMELTAHTSSNKLDAGTSLLIVGGPLKVGAKVRVEFASVEPTLFKVLRVAENEIDIQLRDDGSFWRMTPRTDADPPVGISTELSGQEWVIRRPLPAPTSPQASASEE